MSFEDRFRHTLADSLSEAKSRLEAEFDAVLTDARAQADQERTAALAGVDDARAAAVAEARTVVQAELQAAFDNDIATLRSQVEAASAEAERQRQDAEAAVVNARAQADATVEAVRSELREAQASLLRQREEAEAAMARLQADQESATARLASTDAVTNELRQALEVATRERDEQAAEVARLRDQVETTVTQLRAEFDAKASTARDLADHALASLRTEAQAATALYGSAVGAQQAGSLRMLESVRALDGASSLGEVLDALTIGASKESGRAAMLVVKGDRLIGWRTLGFGHLDQEPRTIESSTSDAGALASAVNSGRPAVTGIGSALGAPSFADAPGDRSGLAVPLLVAGRPVAVLYADPGTASPAAGWTSPVEILVRHAARCLEGLAVQRATASKAAGARVPASA